VPSPSLAPSRQAATLAVILETVSEAAAAPDIATSATYSDHSAAAWNNITKTSVNNRYSPHNMAAE